LVLEPCLICIACLGKIIINLADYTNSYAAAPLELLLAKGKDKIANLQLTIRCDWKSLNGKVLAKYELASTSLLPSCRIGPPCVSSWMLLDGASHATVFVRLERMTSGSGLRQEGGPGYSITGKADGMVDHPFRCPRPRL
jgi:hypothetical protein